MKPVKVKRWVNRLYQNNLTTTLGPSPVYNTQQIELCILGKGQLISKGLFGVFNSSKNEQKQVN